jgi:hypothetical protein
MDSPFSFETSEYFYLIDGVIINYVIPPGFPDQHSQRQGLGLRPGLLILGDRDGVVVVGLEKAAEVLEKSKPSETGRIYTGTLWFRRILKTRGISEEDIYN